MERNTQKNGSRMETSGKTERIATAKQDDRRIGTSKTEHKRIGTARRDDQKIGTAKKDNKRIGTARRDDQKIGTAKKDNKRIGTARRDDQKIGTAKKDNKRIGTAKYDDRRIGTTRTENRRIGTSRTDGKRIDTSVEKMMRLAMSVDDEMQGQQDNTTTKYSHRVSRAAREAVAAKEGKCSRCPVSKKCGGCQMIDVPYQEQLKIKQERVQELLSPYCRVESFIGMDEPEHYRCKVHAVFTHDRKGNPLSGIYREGTHDVVPIEECLLENKKADDIIATIRGMLKSFKIKTFDEDNGFGLLRHVLIRVGHESGQIMVVLVLTSPILPSKNNFVKALRQRHPEITTVVINVNEKQTSMILGDKEKAIYGPGYILDTMCGMEFKISPKSFYQVNPVQTEKLYRTAIELAGLTGKERVLDCYCGVGTIGIIASQHAGEVIGVELNHDAVQDAIGNARRNKIGNITFYENDASRFMLQMADAGEKVDVVFMDPPRSGSTPVFLQAMFRLAPDRVVYISCSPDSLANDLEIITKHGYEAEHAIPVDMFPFTRSVETIVLLRKK